MLFCFLNIKRKVYDLEIIYWKYITMFVFIFNLSFTVIIQSYLGMKMKTVYYLVVFLSLYMTTLGIYWMVFQMNKINKEKVNREYTIKKLQLKQENDKYIKSVNEQLQMIRHDLKHDYELIQYYLDNQEYIKIQELLEYKGIYLSNMHSISCDNKVIESVINTKIIKANKNHKKIYCQITYKGQLKIREHHLYQVLCNLIDNAIEYGDQDYLDVKIDFDNIILLIQVSNPLLIQTTFQTKKINKNMVLD